MSESLHQTCLSCCQDWLLAGEDAAAERTIQRARLDSSNFT